MMVRKKTLKSAETSLYILINEIMGARDHPTADWRWIGGMVGGTVGLDEVTIQCEDLFLIAKHNVSHEEYCERYRDHWAVEGDKINLRSFIRNGKKGINTATK